MRLKLDGRWRDSWPDQGGLVSAERPNVVVFRALDLIGQLLLDRPGFGGLRYWAVGSGDPAWDDQLPEPDRKVRRLVAETFRKPIDPSRDITYEAATRTLIVHVRFEADEAVGTLREFGLYGGDASPWPDSGMLFNYRLHAPIEKAAGEVLDRELRISLQSDAMQIGLLDLIASLLRGPTLLHGIQYLALGSGDSSWDRASPPLNPAATRLVNEVARIPLTPFENLDYDPITRSVVVRVDLPFDAAPFVLREFGLFGGDASDARDSGMLLHWQVHPAIDKTRPIRLSRVFRLHLDPTILVSVPDLLGDDLVAATQALGDLALTVGIVGETEGAEPGQVAGQSPVAGTLVSEGTPINLSLGVARRVAVPSLVGLSPSEASAVLAGVSLALSDAQPKVEESPAPSGTIIRQVPSAGSIVNAGTTVVIVIASPVTTVVPDLSGRNLSEAALILGASGLRLDPAPPAQRPSTRGWNIVVAQQPAAKTRAAVGSTVSVTINGPPTVVVPDLTRQSPDQAVVSLRKAGAEILSKLGLAAEPPGLTLGKQTSEEVGEGDISFGSILRQAPQAGTSSPLYTTVDVVIASPPTILVPDLSGLDQPTAASTLAGVNLRLGLVSSESSRAASGSVVRQSPKAGELAPRGGEVAIVLARAVLVAAPDVIGLSDSAAREVIAGAGLTVGVVTTRLDPVMAGRVVEQLPSPGEDWPLGGPMQLTLGISPPKPVAEVIGPVVAREGGPVSLDASPSHAAEGHRIVKYTWTRLD